MVIKEYISNGQETHCENAGNIPQIFNTRVLLENKVFRRPGGEEIEHRSVYLQDRISFSWNIVLNENVYNLYSLYVFPWLYFVER